MSEFLSQLAGKWGDDTEFILTSPLIYESDVAQTVEVPVGFVTDFASVPRLPIIYSLFGDRAHHESVVHDFLYQTHQTTKAIADKVFKEAMLVRGKSKLLAWSMYWGVVVGGGSAYRTGPSRYTILNQS